MNRRTFLQAAALASLAPFVHAQEKRRPRILLRSSWQVVNIGDIAHTPGVLALLEKHIPEADVILWASGDLSEPVMAMEHKRFPKLKIVKGKIGENGKASNDDLQQAIDWADFFLHGSGPSVVAQADMAAFSKHTKKPYGIYGVTFGGATQPNTLELLSNAKFMFFRDSVSLAKGKEVGIKCPIMEFGPDGAFACDLRNDQAATAFLKANGLEDGKFMCCIGRYRITPYWKIRNKEMTEADKKAVIENEKWRDHDHAPHRDAITRIVKETDLKVLLCPEDMSQMQATKENIYDKLPQDVQKRVVWREKFWLTDEALSTYVRSAGLFGNEMHSPIMSVGNGIPAVVCRWARQTSKGFMWRDIGLGDWLFDMENEEEIPKIAPTVLAIAKDFAGAKKRVAAAQEVVQKRQRETMGILRTALGL